MSTYAPVLTREHYLNASLGWKSWLFTRDHKRIALLFLITITFFFFLGGAFATLIRLELMTPEGDLVQAQTYNKLFSMHGIVMIFLFLIPSIPSVLGNFLVPMMIGARDLAFPRLNLLSWYLLVIGGVFDAMGNRRGRRRYRLDVLHAIQQPVQQYSSRAHGSGHLHRRLFIDPDRPEFHRDDSQDARAGHDVVPLAAVYLVALCDSDHSGSRHARAGDHAGARWRRAHLAESGFSIRRSAEIRCCSSICSGSTRIPPCTS